MQSRMGSRAHSPFGFSRPGTPPDLFLVTRNSPPISQQLWETFQPDQLFPENTNIDGMFSSPTMHHAVDPQLQMAQNSMGTQQAAVTNLSVPQTTMANQQSVWPPGMNGMMGAGMDLPESDGWSTSSSAPVAPTTLNVEDWFQFFGINNGDNMNMTGMEM